MSDMTPQEIEDALVREYGLPRAVARERALASAARNRPLAERIVERTEPRVLGRFVTELTAEAIERCTPREGAFVAWAERTLGAVRLTVPFSALCPDNAKYAPSCDRHGRPKLILKPRYRACKKAVADLAREAMAGRAPLEGPVAIEAFVHFPLTEAGAEKRGDAPNFAKVVHDALEGVVVRNDGQIHDARWRRAPGEHALPRAEITITPLTED